MLCSRNNEELENYYVTVKKLNKTVEQKERSLNELEEEIDLIQQKEAQLNKKREEIYQYFVYFVTSYIGLTSRHTKRRTGLYFYR